jgi:DNA polymerase-1
MWALLDGSYFLHRALHLEVFQEMESEGEPTGGILGVLNEIRKTLDVIRPKRVALIWDDGLSERRLKLYPGYKKKPEPENQEERQASSWLGKVYKHQKDKLTQLLPTFGIRVISVPGMEGDDLLYSIAEKLTGDSDDRVTIVTDDKDLLQCVTAQKSVYRPMADQFITWKNFEEKIGCSPFGFLLKKCVVGDESDKIKGVPGVGEKTFDEAIAGFGYYPIGSVDLFKAFHNHIQHVCATRSSGRIRKLLEGSSLLILLRNLLLMDLSNVQVTPGVMKKIMKGMETKMRFDERATRKMCRHYKFNSLLEHYTSWSIPFRVLR